MTEQHLDDLRALARTAGPNSWSQLVWHVVEVAEIWVGRRRQRRQLAAMSDYLLRDMGIGRAEAEQEAMKPFWRP